MSAILRNFIHISKIYRSEFEIFFFFKIGITQKKAHIVEYYFRTGQKINKDWKYSIGECFPEFREKYPSLPHVLLCFIKFGKNI